MKLRWWVLAACAPAALALLGLVAVMGIGMVAGGAAPALPASSASAAAVTEIPPVALAAYQAGASACPGLDWGILAGIGKEETGHGSYGGHHLDATGQDQPPGLHSAVRNGPLGFAYGPMQFLPGTWATYGPQVAPGLNNSDMDAGPVQNVNSAAKAAALLLCANAGGTVTPANVWAAVDAYSGHTNGYADDVTSLAALYTQPAAAPVNLPGNMPGNMPAPSVTGERIVLAALYTFGAPYADGNPAKGDPGIEFSGHPGGAWVVGHFQALDPRYFSLDCSGEVNVIMKLAFNLDLNYCSADYLHDPRFHPEPMNALAEGDIVIRGTTCGPTGHIAIVAGVNADGTVTIIDAARHGTVVGFRPAMNPNSWDFTAAVRFTG